MDLYDFFLEPARDYQESLMTDSVVVVRNNLVVPWIRTGQITVPCRVHGFHTEVVSPDPGDANFRSMKEWIFTLPWDMDVVIGDFLTAKFAKTRYILSTIVGETSDHETWKISTRAYGTIQKNAVQETTITFKRDDGEGNLTVVGTYQVKLVQEHTAPIEVALRYTEYARSSLAAVRLIFDGQPDVPIQEGDEFVVDGHWGIVREVFPDQPQRTEAMAFVDFSGIQH